MKIKLLTFIILFICLIILVVCENKQEKNIYIIDTTNNDSSLDIERKVWNLNWFENKEAIFEKKLTYKGNVYNGEYINSEMMLGYSYSFDNYKTSDGIHFSFKENTDQLVLLNLMKSDFFDTEPYKDDIENPQEYAIEYAKEIAKDFIKLDDYELMLRDPFVDEREKDGKKYYTTYYYMTFFKKINGVNSSDYMTIRITSKGNLASFIMGDIGVFDNFDKIDFSIDEITAAAKNKIKKQFIKNGSYYIDQKIDKQFIVVTPEGKIAILTGSFVTVKLKGGNGVTGVRLISYID